MLKNKPIGKRFFSVFLVVMLLATAVTFSAVSASAAGGLNLNKTSLTLGVGETYDLNSYYTNNRSVNNVRYRSGNNKIAQVKACGGLVTAKSVGTVNIMAYDEKTQAFAVCKITVKKAPTNIYLNKRYITLCGGEVFDLNSSLPSGQASHSVIYTSSNPSIVNVKSAGGIVTARKKGKAVVTATTYNGKKAVCEIIVKSIKLTDTKGKMITYADSSRAVKLTKGEKYQLNVKRDIKHTFSLLEWVSSNIGIFTIDDNTSPPTIIAGNRSGSTFLNVYTDDGEVDSVRIVVK